MHIKVLVIIKWPPHRPSWTLKAGGLVTHSHKNSAHQDEFEVQKEISFHYALVDFVWGSRYDFCRFCGVISLEFAEQAVEDIPRFFFAE